MQHFWVRLINSACYFAGSWMLSQRLSVAALISVTVYLLAYSGYGWLALQTAGIATLLAGFARYFAIFNF
ncbi:MAG TPA: hypothetical protein VN989_11640 [Casimicrobiaceae bacterium]|nr:hypothetical protein [Casimicrobiaceae bacterium]